MESFKFNITVLVLLSTFVNFSYGLSQQYGPPGTTLLATKQPEPETKYGPPGTTLLTTHESKLDTKYGPPGTTLLTTQESKLDTTYGPPGTTLLTTQESKLDTTYGPPGTTLLATQKSEPDTEYGPPTSNGTGKMEPDTTYGVPGFTPGEPIDFFTYSGNNGASSSSGNSGCKSSDENANKQLVMRFYQEALGDKKVEVANMLALDYINHNPFSSGPGRDNFVKLLKGPLAQAPNQKIDFKRVIADGDMVWTHSTWELGGKKYAAADIFQINCDGLIQEHWDVLQDINIPTMNPHPFF
ncbi:unnamed protein product [Orchesella dallaii]|uniref:SnoaL-like domain-containing protein n=1 Tax=Orchesella dallaii TaxID=48710 RepID=A0ABP1QEE4_9HEXA